MKTRRIASSASPEVPSVRPVDDSDKFVREIVAEVRRGYGVAPLVGSGLSAASGIPMGNQLDGYLAYVTHQVLTKRWDIRTNGWPAYPTGDDVRKANDYIREEFEKHLRKLKIVPDIRDGEIVGFEHEAAAPSHLGFIQELARPLVPRVLRAREAVRDLDRQLVRMCRTLGKADLMFVPHARPNDSPTSEAFLIEKGIRALCDWRATLNFLSCTRVSDLHRPERDRALAEAEYDRAVIDAFNVHITRGKRPNLGHKMLVHLSGPLRSRVLLTTNFDTLLEQAFRQRRMPLEVIDVRTTGGLPSTDTVRAGNTLLKLHGGMVDTRADFTLDDPPAVADRERFVEYLFGTPGRRYVASHLLVIGNSGSDVRIVHLIKHALDRDRSFKVFWVCFSERDETSLNHLFEGEAYGGRVVSYRTRRPDLLLYELYQELTYCLPGGGFSYEFSHKTPPRPSARTTDEPGEFALDLVRKIVSCPVGREKPVDRKGPVAGSPANGTGWVVQAHNPKGVWGAGPEGWSIGQNEWWRKRTHCLVADAYVDAIVAIRDAARLLERDHAAYCVWLEMQDYPSPAYLADDLFRTVSLRCGVHQTEPLIYRAPEGFSARTLRKHVSHWRQLAAHLGMSVVASDDESPRSDRPRATDYVFFLYGRTVPGACSGWSNRCWGDAEYEEFAWLLEALNRCGLRVVYMPYTPHRRDRETAKILAIANHHAGTLRNGTDALRPADARPSRMAGETADGFEGWVRYQNDHAVWSLGAKGADPSKAITTDRFHGPEPLLPEKPTGVRVRHEKRLNGVIAAFFGHGELARRDKVFNALGFLYGVTLFRQSRHLSAFLSESLIECPNRFSLNLPGFGMTPVGEGDEHWDEGGDDNDCLRARTAKDWVQNLARRSVFLRKEGGYMWMYYDMRLGLQAVLDQGVAGPISQDGFDASLRGERDGLEFLGQLRSRTHLFIAEWYQKAFLATGHGIPLIEAVYHCVQSARCALFARPMRLLTDGDQRNEEVRRFRQWLFRSAVRDATKTLMLGRRWLLLWAPPLSCSTGDPLFGDEARSDLRSELKKQREALFAGEKADASEKEVAFLFDEMEDTMRVLLRRGPAREPLGTLRGNARGRPLPRPELRAHEVMSDDIADAYGAFRSAAERSGAKADSPAYKIADELLVVLEKFHADSGSRARERAGRRRRWEAASEEDRAAMDRAAGLEQDDQRRQLKAAAGAVFRKHAIRSGTDPQPDEFVRAIFLLFEIAYLHVKRAKGLLLATPDPSVARAEAEAKGSAAGLSADDVRKAGGDAETEAEAKQDEAEYLARAHWVSVCVCCYYGVALCRDSSAEFLPLEVDLKIWLYTLHGLALGHLHRFYEAYRRFNEASALLSKSDRGLDGPDLAVIRLRRAEVYLMRAKEERRRARLRPDGAEAAAGSGPSHDPSRGFRRYVAALDDAVVNLEQAEDLLQQSGGSRLWTPRHVKLTMRVWEEVAWLYGHAEPDTDGPRRRNLKAPEFEPLLFRKRLDWDKALRDLFRRALNQNVGDAYRRLGVVDCYLRAIRAWKDGFHDIWGKEDIRLVIDVLRSLQEEQEAAGTPWPEMLKAYLENTKALRKRLSGEWRKKQRAIEKDERWPRPAMLA